MGLFSSSKSTSTTDVLDARVDVQDSVATVGGGTSGSVTINANSPQAFDLAGTALNTARDVASDALFSQERLATSAIDAVTDTSNLAITRVSDFSYDVTRNVIDFAGESNRNQASAFENYGDILGSLQSSSLNSIEKLKANEQLGEATQIKELIKYAVIAAIAIFALPQILRELK